MESDKIIILMLKDNAQKSTAIKVYVRVRPLVGQQLGSNEVVQVQQDGKTVKITTDSLSCIETKFDQAISQDQSQRYVFSLFSDYLCKMPEGYNMTIFAYGQTGSGKTYTMFGSNWESAIEKQFKSQNQQNTFFEDLISDENYAGLIPRTIFTLFQEIKAYTNQQSHNFNIYCSFLQIYNEKIFDLLQDLPKPVALNIHESKVDGIFVEGLSQYAVTHYLDCLQLMKRGQKNRKTRKTSMNPISSRSHTIFQILLESTRPDAKGMFKKAKLNLCDLAGSEKVNKTETMDNDHFRELKNINQSLTTLGKVIASLSTTKSKSVAPFRESKLTRLLQDSLSGNTFTFIVGNISPSIKNIDQTMNTLKFVERARHIVMKVKPMQFNGQNMQIVNKLQREIQYLKELLNMKRKGMSPDDIHNKLLHLQQENEQLKKTSVSIDDVEKLLEENRKMKMEIHKLQVTQYGHTEGGENDNKSQYSINSGPITQNKLNLYNSTGTGETNHNKRQLSTGFQANMQSNQLYDNPIIRSPGSSGNLSQKTPNSKLNQDSKKPFVNAGRSVIESGSIYSMPASDKGQRNKEKQKILDKLEELQRIQKYNEQKLMKDLEQLQKKNQHLGNKGGNNLMKKKVLSVSPPSTGQRRPSINYEDKIRELEAKLFGK